MIIRQATQTYWINGAHRVIDIADGVLWILSDTSSTSNLQTNYFFEMSEENNIITTAERLLKSFIGLFLEGFKLPTHKTPREHN